MTQQSTKKDYNNFVQGLITEAGALTFPENASLDEANCVLNRDGSRQRRLGMDFEDDFVLRSVTVLADDAIASFRWYEAANDVDNQLAVVQAGTKLLIFDASEPSISAAYITTIDIAAYTTGKVLLGTSSGMGYFFVTSGTAKPFYLSYNPTTQVVTLSQITMQIRDTFGVEDGLAVDTNPATLSAAHQYNLLNQGWSAAQYGAYFTSQAKYPSNAQQWFVGKDTNDDFQPALLVKHDFGTTPAPKGRYVIDAFARSASRLAVSGVTTAADTETSYPSCIAFANQRLFYAGIESAFSGAAATSPNYTGYVFYSRVIRSAKDFGQCHTDADPTSEIDSELVDTDGGFINIAGSGKIHKIIEKGGAILVFAEKGIWQIIGAEGGFRATAHAVDKITEFGVLSQTSIVDTEDSMMYWNRGGIYLLAPNPETGRLSARNLTDKSIQTFFNEINKVGKQHAVGTFDPINRRVSWMYNDSEDYTGNTFRNRYNKELILDIVLEAFYPNSISEHEEPSPFIAGYLDTPDFLLREEGIRTRGDTITKYLVVQFVDPPANSASVTFGYYRDPDFRDWKSLDGVGTSFVSFVETGYEIMEDSVRDKQANYLVTHFKRTERDSELDVNGDVVAINPSGCIAQAKWNWSDHSDSGKWGQPFQAYRLPRNFILPDTPGPITMGFEVVTTKNRLRGKGKALSLRFQSDGDKDFYLYGWSIRFTGSANV
jgi:hypothetical protein